MHVFACAYVVVCVLLMWAIVHRAMRALFTPPRYTRRTLTLADETAMQSGDLLLFDGHHLDAALIRGWCDAPFSHVGLVWRDRATGVLYVYNSDVDEYHTCALPNCCNLNKKRQDGVQLNDLLLKVGIYRGRVYHVPLRKRLSHAQLDAWEQQLFAQKNLCSRAFRHSLMDMAHLAFPSLVPLYDAAVSHALFCTELVALVYRQLGSNSAKTLVQGQQSPWRLACRLHALGIVDMAHMQLLET